MVGVVDGFSAGRLQSDSLWGSIPPLTSRGSSVTNSDTLDNSATWRVRLAKIQNVEIVLASVPCGAPCLRNCQWYTSHMRKIREHHPLALLFMLESLAYGIGFLLLPRMAELGTSSLYVTMSGFGTHIIVIWGVALILSVVITLAGYRLASLLGSMAWIFAVICYGLDGNWLVLVAVAVPNMLYWFWQHTH